MVRKVLMLHGYTQNAIIFSKRTGAIRKACGKDVEFVYVEAPNVLLPADFRIWDPAVEPSTAPDTGTDHPLTKEELAARTARGWWRTNRERTCSVGLEASLVVLRDILRGSRFHGVFGFSQGAAMAALLAALLERPHLHPEFLVDGEPPHPPFQFCICVSGFVAPGSLSKDVFATPFTTPTLHVLGKTDILVVAERSRPLVAVSARARVEEHPSGHFVPSTGSWRALFTACIRDPNGEITSPGDLTGTPDSTESATMTEFSAITSDLNRL